MKYLISIVIITATFFIGRQFSDDKSYENRYESYELVWEDDFEKPGMPDPEKWSYDTAGNSWGWGNNELQHYTFKDPENVRVEDGVLYIQAKKEPINQKKYSSVRLITKNKGDWKYGRVDVMAKLPEGRGLWPAIWMLPTNNTYGNWPQSGEIDIMEHVGYNPDTVFATAHTEAYNHSIGTEKSKGKFVENVYDDFHEYSLEWTPEAYHVYMDGDLFFTFNNENKTSAQWPYDQPFYLIINLAVGGNWGGRHGVDTTAFPAELAIEYVRVYQKKELE